LKRGLTKNKKSFISEETTNQICQNIKQEAVKKSPILEDWHLYLPKKLSNAQKHNIKSGSNNRNIIFKKLQKGVK
jgi:hypothetical protein